MSNNPGKTMKKSPKSWLCDTENVKFTLALKTVYNIVNIGWRRYEVVSIETGNFAILKNQDVEIKGEIKTARATRLVTSMEAKCTFPASFSRYSIKGKQIEDILIISQTGCILSCFIMPPVFATWLKLFTSLVHIGWTFYIEYNTYFPLKSSIDEHTFN